MITENIDSKIIQYCETQIIPQYLDLDLAHQPNHVYDVIEKSLDIASEYDVNLNMVYVIAVFHDLGLKVNRKTHHIEGGIILYEDDYIRQRFTANDILTMQQAIEDHRASSKFEPRSIYGKIISEADRLIEPEYIILRCIQFQLSKTKDTSFDSIYPSVLLHLNEKYGHQGYLKLWLKTKQNDKQLQQLRMIINDVKTLHSMAKDIYQKYMHEHGL